MEQICVVIAVNVWFSYVNHVNYNDMEFLSHFHSFLATALVIFFLCNSNSMGIAFYCKFVAIYCMIPQMCTSLDSRVELSYIYPAFPYTVYPTQPHIMFSFVLHFLCGYTSCSSDRSGISFWILGQVKRLLHNMSFTVEVLHYVHRSGLQFQHNDVFIQVLPICNKTPMLCLKTY